MYADHINYIYIRCLSLLLQVSKMAFWLENLLLITISPLDLLSFLLSLSLSLSVLWFHFISSTPFPPRPPPTPAIKYQTPPPRLTLTSVEWFSVGDFQLAQSLVKSGGRWPIDLLYRVSVQSSSWGPSVTRPSWWLWSALQSRVLETTYLIAVEISRKIRNQCSNRL